MTTRYTRKALQNLVKYTGVHTPREAAELFVSWLLSSTCPREAAFDVYDFAYSQGIRL